MKELLCIKIPFNRVCDYTQQITIIGVLLIIMKISGYQLPISKAILYISIYGLIKSIIMYGPINDILIRQLILKFYLMAELFIVIVSIIFVLNPETIIIAGMTLYACFCMILEQIKAPFDD